MDYFELPEYPNLKFPWYKRPSKYLWNILRKFVYSRDNGICNYCKFNFELFQTHIHHVLELSEGGTNHPTNLKLLCIDCHKIKHPFMQDGGDKLRLQRVLG